MKKIIFLSLLGAFAISASASTINSCVSCHGQNFQKKALGKSKIVKNMSVEEIKTALIGYKNGTYGGSMKMIMKGQVSRISNIEATAQEVYNKTHPALDKTIGKSDENKDSIPLTKADKKCQIKCSKELKKIDDCVTKAHDQKSMLKCRISLIKLANKIQKKFNVIIKEGK